MNSKRKTISQPEDWWEAAEAEAKAKGKDLSEWLGDLIKKALPKAEREKLSPRKGRGWILKKDA